MMQGRKLSGLFGAICGLGAVCSCATPAVEADPGLQHMETDVITLSISAGRYAYLIELARAGAFAGQPDSYVVPGDTEDQLRAATAATLRDGVFDLYQLQANVCEFGLVEAQDCGPIAPPDWLGEAPGAAPSVEELNRRIWWLEEAMDPYVGAGCDAGEAEAAAREGGSWDDPDNWRPHYCSVE